MSLGFYRESKFVFKLAFLIFNRLAYFWFDILDLNYSDCGDDGAYYSGYSLILLLSCSDSFFSLFLFSWSATGSMMIASSHDYVLLTLFNGSFFVYYFIKGWVSLDGSDYLFIPKLGKLGLLFNYLFLYTCFSYLYYPTFRSGF